MVKNAGLVDAVMVKGVGSENNHKIKGAEKGRDSQERGV